MKITPKWKVLEKKKLAFEDFWGCLHTFIVKPPEKHVTLMGIKVLFT